MTQIKIFCARNFCDVENTVNDWLANNNVEIISSSFSDSGIDSYVLLMYNIK